MIAILSDSPKENKEGKIILRYQIDEHENTALDTVFDELFSAITTQQYPLPSREESQL